jgi:glyoxylase I family protein
MGPKHTLSDAAAIQSIFMFKGIEHTAISSPNPEALANWYVEHLEFHINYTYAGNYFVKAANGTVLEIIPAANTLEKPQTTDNNKDAGIRHLAILPENFDEAYASLQKKGVHFVGAPFENQGNKLVFFNDLDGNLLHLIHRERPLP